MIFEAQRALAREEGLFVEPSSAAALAAVHAARLPPQPLDPAQTIVVVLTSGGLKDPAASRTWLPAGAWRRSDDLADVLTVLRDTHGLALGR